MMTNLDMAVQLEAIAKELRALSAPPEPSGPTITDSETLKALFTNGGTGRLASATDYGGNFVIRKPVTLTGPPDAVLMPTDPLQPTLTGLAGSTNLSGFTVQNGAPDRDCVVVGDFAATLAAMQPQNVTLDGLTVQAGVKGGHRGIALHGSDLTVRHCKVLGFYEVGRDSQAVWILNGPGPYTVEDCILEASGENILIGGETIHIQDCVPSDITIRRNEIRKPQAWRTNGATVKNLVEVKCGRRVLIEDNKLSGCWRNGQDGTPVLFTVRNQNKDTPWAIVDDVTFRNNGVFQCPDAFAVSILGSDNEYPSQQTGMIFIEGNLFADSPYGVKVGNGVTKQLTIRRNTFAGIKKNFLSFYDTDAYRTSSVLAFLDNVVRSGEYGISSAEAAVGVPTLELWAPGYQFAGNVIEQSADRNIPYPSGNTVVPAGQLSALLDPVTFKLLSGEVGY